MCLLVLGTKVMAREPQRPKLVIGIVADQMRWDYLFRYYDRYSDKGLKRLMDEGFNCQNTYINYLPSYTAPGHAAIYTGTVPALHGIVANDWVDHRTGRKWYCTEDTTVTSIGGGKAGLMSPRNMLATTIADEMRLATNFRSRTIGISIKDRGAILPVGHSATAAYWYDGSQGHFISSSYYGHKSLPEWLVRFNDRNVTDSLMQLDWHTLYPISSYVQSTADDNVYEEAAKGEVGPVFPHRTSEVKDKGAIKNTVYGNTLTRLVAEACIEGEGLGAGEVTDFLALSFSSTDYIGHQYGPNSIEVEDTYLRFDREIAALLQFLDKKLGKNTYTVFLTADHGGAHNAAFLSDHRIPAQPVSVRKWAEQLNQVLSGHYGTDGLVKSLLNYQVHLNEELIASKQMDREGIKSTIKKELRNWEGVVQVVDLEQPGLDRIPVAVDNMISNGYYPGRSGILQLVLNPGWYSSSSTRGTTHGSWNPYDTHIPLLWYGCGIKKGSTFRNVSITDIAPTLAALLHIQMPNASVGQVIGEVLR